MDQKHASTSCICFSAVRLAVGVVFSWKGKHTKTTQQNCIENKCHKFIIVIVENVIVKIMEIVLSPRIIFSLFNTIRLHYIIAVDPGDVSQIRVI